MEDSALLQLVKSQLKTVPNEAEIEYELEQKNKTRQLQYEVIVLLNK